MHLWQFIERGSNVLSAVLSTQLPWFTFPICLSQTALSRGWKEERWPVNSMSLYSTINSRRMNQRCVFLFEHLSQLPTFPVKMSVGVNCESSLFQPIIVILVEQWPPVVIVIIMAAQGVVGRNQAHTQSARLQRPTFKWPELCYCNITWCTGAQKYSPKSLHHERSIISSQSALSLSSFHGINDLGYILYIT